MGVMALVLIPIVLTLLFQGSGDNFILQTSTEIPSDIQKVTFDENILPGILAKEIDISAETEAIRAQAVVARTNYLRAMQNGEPLPETLSKNEMLKLWGQDNFTECYQQLESCVEDTKGIAMQYQGEYIKAEYHSVSAGATRLASDVYQTQDYPYLLRVDCKYDIPAKNFLKVEFFTAEKFLEKGTGLPFSEMEGKTAEETLGQIVITKRDSADYVTELTIGGTKISGEEFRLAYGLNSACFYVKAVENNIRIVTKGLGHGLGLSLYGANVMAKEGKDYSEILKYFYKDIEFITCND